jgi:predicted Zn-dependent peptidase
VYALDNVGGFGGVADRLNAYNIYLGDPGRIVSDFERYHRATPDDLQRVAARYLADRPRVSLEVLGRKGPLAATSLDRSRVPEPAPAASFRAPKPIVITLRDGMPVWVLPGRDLPIVAASAVLRAGASAHRSDRAGLASLTAAMLDEGTTSRSAHELALTAEGLGTHLSASCGWDGSYVSLQCLTPHLDASLDLAVDILLRPSFPESEWTRVHAQTLASLRAEYDSAEARAYRGLLKAIYDRGHGYRVPIDGEESTVAALTRDELNLFHRAHYQPSRAAWVVAGDVDPDEVARQIEDRIADWRGGAEPVSSVPPRPESEGLQIVLLDRPAAPQAVVQVGHAGVGRHDPDYTDLLVFNQILGGQFTSRLNTKLREEKGFTYGVRSRFDFRRGPGPFHISASLQSDRLAEALIDLRQEVVDLLGNRPPTQAELDDARRALIEGQARHFETPAGLASRFAELFVQALPLDEHARLPERLAGVTTDSMVAAARRHVRSDALCFVVVADAELVASDLGALGWGPVVRLKDDWEIPA